MAWATKYQFKFDSAHGVEHRILIQKDGYSGDIIKRRLGRGPVLKKQKNGPICGTSLEIYAECINDGEFAQDFFTSNPKDLRVRLYRGNNLIWTGFVSAEAYSEPNIAPPYDVQVLATDGLGELKLVTFVPAGAVTLSEHFRTALAYAGESHTIYVASALIMTGQATTATFGMSINLDYLADKSYYDVLTALLDSLHATITMYNGNWLIARETDLSSLLSGGALSVVSIDENGTVSTTTLSGVAKTVGSLADDTKDTWPVGYLSTAIEPARREVTVEAPWHTVSGPADPSMEATTGSPWTTEGQVTHNTTGDCYYELGLNQSEPDASEWGTIKQDIQINKLDCGFELKLRVAPRVYRYPISSSQLNAYGKVKVHLEYDLYVTQASTTHTSTYIGTEEGWNSSARIEIPSTELKSIGERWLSVKIPAIATPSSSTRYLVSDTAIVRIVIEGYWVDVYECILTPSLDLPGYQDIIKINNGARGAENAVEITGGRVRSDNLVNNMFYGGIWLYGGVPVTSFADSQNQGGDFLAIAALSYASSVANARLRTEGSINVPADFITIPLFLTVEDVPAWLETWEWDILEDEAKISLLSLPANQINVESETVSGLPDGYSGSSSGGTGSGSSSTSAYSYKNDGSAYFEEDGNGGVKLKDEYNGLWAAGFIAAGGVGSSSGGSGIDLDRVWQSLTNNTDKPNVKINAAHIPIATAAAIGGVKPDGTTITIDANGVISAVGGSSGSVTSVALTVPTGLSVSGSPITSSGTLAITFENGYSIPTTAKQSNWDSAYNNSHSHSNKSVLDGISSNDVSNWGTAYSNSHSHSNKSTLDGISASDITNWNAAYGWGDHSGLYLPISGGTLTGDLRIKGSTNYGRKLNFGDGDYVFLYEDSDDHLQIKGNNGIQILTGSSYYVQIDNEVVIGETSRQSAYKLYVKGAGYYNGALTVNSNISSTALITVGSGTSTEIARKICFGSTSYYLSLNTSNQFHFSHGVYSDSFMIAGGSASSSDRRLKSDIEDVGEDRALAVLMQLRPKEWTWNEKSACFAGMRGAGLVAQDVQEVLPFAVMDVGDYLSMNYSVLHAYEIAGLRNHEERIAALEAENKILRKQIAAYATR